jgi:glycosyltransferase EpsD
MPSFREGLSVSIMEAMACSLPVICSDIRGNRDLIINSKGGYLCNPHRIDEFQRAIFKLKDNNDIRTKMGSFNKKRIKIGIFHPVDSVGNLTGKIHGERMIWGRKSWFSTVYHREFYCR